MRHSPNTLRPIAALTALLLMLAGTAYAGDAAARNVLGFSPDGATFAFEQYSQLYYSTEIVAEIQVVDTRTDSFVKGSPFRVRTDSGDESDVASVRAALLARATPLLQRRGIGEPGARFAGKPSAGLDEIEIYQMATAPLASRQTIELPDGRKLALALSDQALGKASCYGAGGRGTHGDVIVTGMKLEMAIDGHAPMLLAHDTRLPKARRCVTAYGIAEVWHHQAAGGAQTLAVLIETVDAHEFHAGPNRRFMVMTRRLPPA